MRNRAVISAIAVLLAVFALWGCSKDDSVQPGGPVAPGLPSVNTMMVDFSFFESAPGEATRDASGRPAGPVLGSLESSRLNFVNAAARTVLLEAGVLAASALPVAAFAVAIHSVPQHQPDDSWLWTYIFMDGGDEYDILLSGKQMQGYVEWRMVVSSSAAPVPLDHFLWFDGQVQNDRQSGYWQFYEPASLGPFATTASASLMETPGAPSIRVDWADDGTDRELAFLVNKAGAPSEGTTLTFAETAAQSSIAFYDSVKQTTGTIVWYLDGSGSIEWPDYNSGIKGCWDAMRFDVDCPL